MSYKYEVSEEQASKDFWECFKALTQGCCQ